MDFSSGIAFFFGQLSKLFFSLGSHFSLTSLAAALIVSALYFAWQRQSAAAASACAPSGARCFRAAS